MNLDFLDNTLVRILIITTLAYIAHKLSGLVARRVVAKMLAFQEKDNSVAQRKRNETLSTIFSTTIGALVWLIAAGMIISLLGFDVSQAAAGAGFLGLVVGLGAQSTIRDYLAGIAILVENQYRIGDIVTLDTGSQTSGVVEDVTLRITRLRDLEGNVHIIRNGEATIITNRTFKFSRVIIEVGVGYESDIDEVEKVMNKVGKELAEDEKFARRTKKPIEFLRVDSFGDSSVNVKAIGDVAPSEQWEIAGEYRRRLLKAFEKAGIEIPFPQRVVHQAKK